MKLNYITFKNLVIFHSLCLTISRKSHVFGNRTTCVYFDSLK